MEQAKMYYLGKEVVAEGFRSVGGRLVHEVTLIDNSKYDVTDEDYAEMGGTLPYPETADATEEATVGVDTATGEDKTVETQLNADPKAPETPEAPETPADVTGTQAQPTGDATGAVGAGFQG